MVIGFIEPVVNSSALKEQRQNKGTEDVKLKWLIIFKKKWPFSPPSKSYYKYIEYTLSLYLFKGQPFHQASNRPLANRESCPEQEYFDFLIKKNSSNESLINSSTIEYDCILSNMVDNGVCF